jgi:hypothetical protein
VQFERLKTSSQVYTVYGCLYMGENMGLGRMSEQVQFVTIKISPQVCIWWSIYGGKHGAGKHE